LKKGFKQTEVGVIPEDWNVKPLKKVSSMNGRIGWQGLKQEEFTDNPDDPFLITGMNFKHGEIRWEEVYHIPPKRYEEDTAIQIKTDDVLMTKDGTIGKLLYVDSIPHPGKASLNSHLLVFRPLDNQYVPKFLFYQLHSKAFTEYIELNKSGSTFFGLTQEATGNYKTFLPPLPEQHAIAKALGDVDVLLVALEKLIAKKCDLKQAAMQQLLTGQKRLPGFHGEWEVKMLQEITDCFDNVRVPLNEAQRERMRGDYPYCGANGVLDFVDGYVIDDDIILIAEDGGYFDEYAYRPIAYRMIGKCWVNNHAHILKAKPGFDQGFVFYSLVHKNILNFLASGTRAKLNRSEMNKIEVRLPCDEPEQAEISGVLSDMDAEIGALKQRLAKTRALKQGMMQELLTGKTRLI